MLNKFEFKFLFLILIAYGSAHVYASDWKYSGAITDRMQQVINVQARQEARQVADQEYQSKRAYWTTKERDLVESFTYDVKRDFLEYKARSAIVSSCKHIKDEATVVGESVIEHYEFYECGKKGCVLEKYYSEWQGKTYNIGRRNAGLLRGREIEPNYFVAALALDQKCLEEEALAEKKFKARVISAAAIVGTAATAFLSKK